MSTSLLKSLWNWYVIKLRPFAILLGISKKYNLLRYVEVHPKSTVNAILLYINEWGEQNNVASV